MIKIPRKITKVFGKHERTYKHYELLKIYPHFVAYKCIETGLIENFTKNDFYTKEDKENDKTTNEANEL